MRNGQVKFKEKTVEIPIDRYPELEKDDKRYLGLIGYIMEIEKYRSSFYPKLEELKQKIGCRFWK